MKHTDRIVITGLGIISPIGIGKEEFSRSLFEGKSGLKEIDFKNLSKNSHKNKKAYLVRDFKPEDYLTKDKFYDTDRLIQMSLCAAKLAIDDAKIDLSQEAANTGVILATAGALNSAVDFFRDFNRGGPHYVEPKQFPNTLDNAVASRISIAFGLSLMNESLGDYFLGGHRAIAEAFDFIKQNKGAIILAGGVNEITSESYSAYSSCGFLAGLNGPEICVPFDRKRNGFILGEGACFVVMETEESVLRRGANIYAQILGYAESFDPFGLWRFNPEATGAKRAIQKVLYNSTVDPEEIDYISSSASSHLDGDLMETKAIKTSFNHRAKTIPVSAIKSIIGETISASGAFQVASSALSLKINTIPPTINYEQTDPECDLGYVSNKSGKLSIRRTLVNGFGFTGHNIAMVLGKV